MKINITFENGETLKFDSGTAIYQIAEYYQAYMINPILGCTINNEIVPMNKKLTHDANIKFLDVLDQNGYKMYQAGIKYIFEVALKETYGNEARVSYEHSVPKGLIASVDGIDINNEVLSNIKNSMARIISGDIPFVRFETDKYDAIKHFIKNNQIEKADNIRNINTNTVTLYKLKNNVNYYYSKMPYSTRSISKFEIVDLGKNKIALMYPSKVTKGKVPEYIHYEKVINCFEQDKNWLKLLNVPYASDINRITASLEIKDFIRTSEMDFNNKIYNIVNDIIAKDSVKFILVAGPSSSGKTTTTKKIALNLQSRGFKPIVISTDDYFLERGKTPIDPETGKPDYESLRAVDIELFNHDLKALLNGETVQMPVFNFMTGKREYYDHYTKLEENSIVLIEGLHTLNNELTPDISDEYKYHIYLSPFIPLNIDRHNYVSTLDLRFLRRLSRDYQTRNRTIEKIFETWADVRSGEQKYIFPYIHQADQVLNTALPYEIGVLKVLCEPLLLSVSVDSEYYEEAKRLLDFLKIFYTINNEYVPTDSIIREFIGGSIFE